MTPRPQPGEPFNPYGWFDGIFIPNWLYRRPEITGNAKILYARLVRFTAKGGDCRPSQEYLANDLNISVRTVRRLVQELEAAELVRVVQRGLNVPNIYVFLWHDWMTDEGVWYPHDDAAGPDNLAAPDRTDLTGPDRTQMAGHERTDLSGPLPYEQERVTKGERTRRERRVRQGIPRRPPEHDHDDEAAGMRQGRGRETPPSSPPARAGSGRGLAQHFRRTAIKTWGFERMGPSPFNDQALAKEIVAWRRDSNITEEEIRTMIDLFCSEPLPEGKPPWVSFLAARARLAKRAQKRTVERSPDRYRVPYLDDDD